MAILIRLAALCAASIFAVTSVEAQDVIRVGEGPFITGGGYYVAEGKGYFKKLGLDVQPKMFIDGAMAVPSLISGELDISFMTSNAALFNSIAKGAPIIFILDRGNNKRGFGYTVINVTQELYDTGVKSLSDFAKLSAKRIGLGATGSINQYLFARGLQQAGLDPRKDVQWITNIPQPDLMKMLGQKQVQATDLAYQFGYFAQKNNWGPIVAVDDEIDPDGAVGLYAARKQFIQQHRDVLVRFAMAYLQGVKEFDAAVMAPDAHPDIVDILAKRTALQTPELVRAIAPHWSYSNEDGIPNIKSVMAQQDYWADYFHLVERKVPESDLFDLSIAREAKASLDRLTPFDR